jgi:4,5:9,10-diseco-3-hydroxy-5,9,17-trioxoandrosta-1(10),2-diene-4-oate hydrolase
MADSANGPPQAKFQQVGDIRMHYHDLMPEDAIGTVVFVHGSGPGASGYSNFKKNMEAFRDAGYRVIVPDLPGFGYSSKPTDRDYTSAFFAACLTGLLTAINVDEFSLIGNSLGGAISIRVALDHPDSVSKLVLMAPGGIEDLDRYMAMPAMAKMISNFVGGQLDQQGLRRVMETLVFDPSHVTDELVNERWAILQDQPPEVLSRMIIPNMEADLGSLQCPVLSFWGVDDELLPASGGQKITRACGRSRHIELSQCGHWVMVEHTRLFNTSCLDFLAND